MPAPAQRRGMRAEACRPSGQGVGTARAADIGQEEARVERLTASLDDEELSILAKPCLRSTAGIRR